MNSKLIGIVFGLTLALIPLVRMSAQESNAPENRPSRTSELT